MEHSSRKIVSVVAYLFLALSVPHILRADMKLYLKDGTYHLVKSYEVRGERVRFYSVERSDWEEIPKALVDFEATERTQREEKTVNKKEQEAARALDRERFETPEAAGVEIAPGVRLPGDEGVYAFDGHSVLRMIPSSGEVVTDKKRAAMVLALPGPLMKNRAYVVLPGPRATIRVMATQPTFYVQASDDLGGKLELVTVKSRKESRQVEKVEWRAGITKPAELRAAVPLERTKIAPGVYKLALKQPLDPGEYALGELLQKKMNLVELWDFGIEGAPSHVLSDSEAPPTIRRTGKKPED